MNFVTAWVRWCGTGRVAMMAMVLLAVGCDAGMRDSDRAVINALGKSAIGESVATFRNRVEHQTTLEQIKLTLVREDGSQQTFHLQAPANFGATNPVGVVVARDGVIQGISVRQADSLETPYSEDIPDRISPALAQTRDEKLLGKQCFRPVCDFRWRCRRKSQTGRAV